MSSDIPGGVAGGAVRRCHGCRAPAGGAAAGASAAPRGRPRSQEADRAILTATVELLAERGLAAMSIEEVAARAGSARRDLPALAVQGPARAGRVRRLVPRRTTAARHRHATRRPALGPARVGAGGHPDGDGADADRADRRGAVRPGIARGLAGPGLEPLRERRG